MYNFKHLRYFWAAAKSGGVVKAGELLHVSAQTVSGQITLLEDAVGQPLFRKVGRRLELTDAGRTMFAYADEIFAIGEELHDTMRNGKSRRAVREFRVGVADAMPKSVAYWLLEPAMRVGEPVRMACREWKLDSLLSELALNKLDLVIADVPLPANVNVKAFSHKLGSSTISFFASPSLMKGQRLRFPDCLGTLPLLLPGPDAAVRPRLEGWMRNLGLPVNVAGEFDDGALMKAFGRHGHGVFAASTILADEITTQYGVKVIGEVDEVFDEFFAISVERRITHPCVAAITAAARKQLQ
jgi:LysR family transcriptional regulator, transcriptional activator of nhaA